MSVFKFKQFSIHQTANAMKVGTDAMVLGSSIEGSAPETILDIGGGTGVISLMLAQRFPNASIQAIEIDPKSASECEHNFEQSKWNNRLSVIQADFLNWETNESFDLVVSNPPFYQSTLENEDKRKSTARHQSALPMEAMLLKVSALLKSDGAFWVIVPASYEDIWCSSATAFQLYPNRIIRVFGKEGGEVKRSIITFTQLSCETMIEHFCIRNANGTYTNSYIAQTREFHFNDLSAD